MLLEIFDDSVRLETGVKHNAVILAGQVGDVAVLVERHGYNGPDLELGIWHDKYPFHTKAGLSTIFCWRSLLQEGI